MSALKKFYDQRAHVLYISLGEPTAAVSEPLRSGVLLREDRTTGQFVGVTLIDFDVSRRHDYEKVLTDSPKVPRDILPALLAQIAGALKEQTR